jgi:hypothetical protein
VELSVNRCLEVLDITELSDWDVLAFLYRHGVSLTSAEQIARLIGYGSTAVGAALDRLSSKSIAKKSTGRSGRVKRVSCGARLSERLLKDAASQRVWPAIPTFRVWLVHLYRKSGVPTQRSARPQPIQFPYKLF